MNRNQKRKLEREQKKQTSRIKNQFQNQVVKSLFNGGIYLNTNGIYHPITNEEGVIKTSLVTGRIDEIKKEITISYEVLNESSGWVLKEMERMNPYYLHLLGEGDRNISEMILKELKDYTIITQRYFNSMMFMGVVEPKFKENNKWFN
jgi:hypothetical protein